MYLRNTYLGYKCTIVILFYNNFLKEIYCLQSQGAGEAERIGLI